MELPLGLSKSVYFLRCGIWLPVYGQFSRISIRMIMYKIFFQTLGNNIFFRSSRPKVFCKNSVLRNFIKFTGKHLCQSFFFNKVKKETLAKVFSCEFCEISKITFLQKTSGGCFCFFV